jgi:O-antigen/teichoic acid export membrane protein
VIESSAPKRQRLTAGPFGRSIILLAGGTAVGQLVTVLASPILTRLYTPSDFGVVAVFVAILAILQSVATLRYELAIPLAPDDQSAADLLALCGLALALVAGVVSVLVWVFGDAVEGWANNPELGTFLWLLPVGLLAVGGSQALSYWVVRKKAYIRVARTRITQAVAQVGAQAAIGALREGPAGLVIGAVLGRTGGIASYLSLAWKHDRETLTGVSWAGIRRAARRYRRFPVFSSGSAFLNSAGGQLPTILLGAFYGPTVLGWFALTQRIIGLPLVVVGNAVTQAYLGEASAHLHGDRSPLRRLYFRSTRRLAIVGLFPLALLTIGGPWLFTHVFGSSWTEAGTYVRVLAPMYYIQFIVVPLSQTLTIFERLQLQLVYDVIRLVVGIGALVTAHLLGLSAVAALGLYSASVSCAYGINYFLNSRTIIEETA